MTEPVSSDATQEQEVVLDDVVEVEETDVVEEADAVEEEEIGDEAAEIDPDPTEGLDAEPDDDDVEMHPFRLAAPAVEG